MSRKHVYKQTKEFLKGRWFRILIMSFLFTYLFSSFSSVMFGNRVSEAMWVFSPEYNFMFSEGEQVQAFIEQITKATVWVSVLSFVITILRKVLSNALSVEIKEAYQTNTQIRVNDTFNHAKENFWTFVLHSLIESIFIGMVVAFFVSIFMFVVFAFMSLFSIGETYVSTDSFFYGSSNYYVEDTQNVVLGAFVVLTALSLFTVLLAGIQYIMYTLKYVPFIIQENKEIDIFDAFKKSAELTKGHRLSLFVLELSYSIKVILPLIIGFIIMLIFAGMEAIFLMMVTLALTFFATIALGIYYTPHMLSAVPIYYVESTIYAKEREELIFGIKQSEDLEEVEVYGSVEEIEEIEKIEDAEDVEDVEEVVVEEVVVEEVVAEEVEEIEEAEVEELEEESDKKDSE